MSRVARLRSLARWLAPIVVGIAGAWVALAAAGHLRHDVGPFRVEMFARPGKGVTEIALPPFGRLLANTHVAPLRLTATLDEVAAPELTEVVRHKGIDGLAREAEEEGLAALRVYVWQAILVGGGGGAALGALLYRRRWRPVVGSALAAILFLGGSTALAAATYRPEAFLQPTFTGSLALAPRLVGPVREATGRIDDFRAELEHVVTGAVDAYARIATTPSISRSEVTLLHISDIHASPLGMDFAQRLARSFEVDLVVDTGDLTSFGTSLEQGVTQRIEEFGVPFVFVRGNHDSVLTVAEVTAQENAIVLDHEAREVAGLTIYGAPFPIFTPTEERVRDNEAFAESIRAVGEVVEAEVSRLPAPPDLLAVHDDRMAVAAAGRVPVVVSGHYHATGSREMDGSLFLRLGTTSGGGLDTFGAVDPIPFSAQILYFDGEPLELVAWDTVQLEPITQNLTVSRNLPGTTEPAPEEEPVPVES